MYAGEVQKMKLWDRIFALPPVEKRRIPEWLAKGCTDPMQELPDSKNPVIYINYVSARSSFLLSCFLGILYYISQVWNISINLGFFSIAMPAENFNWYFLEHFPAHIPTILFFTLFPYYVIATLKNTDSYTEILKNSDSGNDVSNEKLAWYYAVPVVLISVVAAYGVGDGIEFILKYFGAPERAYIYNSYTTLFFLILFISLTCAIFIVLSISYTSFFISFYFGNHHKKHGCGKQERENNNNKIAIEVSDDDRVE